MKDIYDLEQLCREFYEDRTITLEQFVPRFCEWLQSQSEKDQAEISILVERILYVCERVR